jgi:hypothetical protein
MIEVTYQASSRPHNPTHEMTLKAITLLKDIGLHALVTGKKE